MHLDGARFFNAISETGDTAAEFGKYFDTISICLSKGLGAPVGSVLACRKDFALKAKRIRKVFGGGMRQAGYLAAAGTYALNHHIGRLKEDHLRAKVLGKAIGQLSFVKSVMPVDTNIVIFELQPNVKPEMLLSKLAEQNLKALAFSATEVRLVTHLDFNDEMLDQAIDVFSKIKF
jgi:threonine aldolase